MTFTKLDERERADLQADVERRGTKAVAEDIGLAEATIARMAAGIDVRRASVTAFRSSRLSRAA